MQVFQNPEIKQKKNTSHCNTLIKNESFSVKLKIKISIEDMCGNPMPISHVTAYSSGSKPQYPMSQLILLVLNPNIPCHNLFFWF